MQKLQVMLDKGAHIPTRSHADDAGLDLYAPDGARHVEIMGGTSAVVDTGVHVLLPRGYTGLVCPRSGLNVKHATVPGIGVIDAGYTGTILVRVYNHNPNREEVLDIAPGDRIAQLLILPIWYLEPELVEGFPETERGDAGYGSTGR